jgi:HEPN domain-containing protein
MAKSAEQMKDDNDRTTPMGLFNLAEAYRLSATRLQASPVKAGHAESPLRFLYYHALELYLKALLRQKYSVRTLSSKKFGHKIQRLVKKAEQLDLEIEDEDREVFSLVADTDTVIEARYIRTGFKSLPPLEGLKRASENVRNHVGARLRELGVMVRL